MSRKTIPNGQPGMTPERMLVLISRFIAKHGYSPSIPELMALAGLRSTSAAHYHLEALKYDGRITWQAGKQRTIRVLP